MVVVFSSLKSSFKYCIGERKAEVELFKKTLNSETIIAAPMLHEERFIFIFSECGLKFEMNKDLIEEITEILLEEFKNSHLKEIDFFLNGDLAKMKTLKVLRKESMTNRVVMIRNPDIMKELSKTRHIAHFCYDETGRLNDFLFYKK